MGKIGQWMANKSMEWAMNSMWKRLHIGDRIKVIEFGDYETQENEMKYWIRIDSLNEEDRTATGPIDYYQCGDGIKEGDIRTVHAVYHIGYESQQDHANRIEDPDIYLREAFDGQFGKGALAKQRKENHEKDSTSS